MPFWKAGKNDDQVLDELKETQKQNADEFVKKQEHADEAQKSSLIIDNNFTPVEYDPQYILQVNHLKKYFPIKGGMVSKTVGYVKAVDGVTFNLKRGTTMGLVGESGCGKTTTGRTILRLYDSKSGGQVLFNGQEVYDLSHKELRALRTKMQIIFQDPFSSLSPRMPVGEIIGEAVREHNLVPKAEFDDYIDQVMDNCGLQPFHKDRYPHEFSGGQRQRICIARALALNPEFIVCDEPVSALDVSIQAQIINLLNELQDKYKLTYLFISHDLSVVEHISDTVGVMYLGNLVEYGAKEDIFRNPLHPYTKALFSAIPIPDPKVKMNRIVLEGSYAGAASFSAWDDSSGNNRRMLEVRNASYESGRDNALLLRDVVNGTYYAFRIFHAGMATPVPVANGGTGASSAKAALSNLGIFYAATLPSTGTDGQICLVPV